MEPKDWSQKSKSYKINYFHQLGELFREIAKDDDSQALGAVSGCSGAEGKKEIDNETGKAGAGFGASASHGLD